MAVCLVYFPVPVLIRSITRRPEYKPKNPPLFLTVNLKFKKFARQKYKQFQNVLISYAEEQEFKSSQFHLGLEAAAALRGVALQRGRVQRAAAAASYPAAAAAAAAAAMARPQLTAASLQYVTFDSPEVKSALVTKYSFLQSTHRGAYYDNLMAQVQAQAQAQASDAYRLQVGQQYVITIF